MERLWSPWRLPYVSGAKTPQGCIFCNAVDNPDDPLVVFRGSAALVILNRYPYNNGHLMIAPMRHVDTLSVLSHQESTEIMMLTQRSETALADAYRPDGLNVGINLGRAAGAGIVDHVHVHIVPRWAGDTNFITVAGEVRVLAETLEDTAARLRPIFERLAKS